MLVSIHQPDFAAFEIVDEFLVFRRAHVVRPDDLCRGQVSTIIDPFVEAHIRVWIVVNYGELVARVTFKLAKDLCTPVIRSRQVAPVRNFVVCQARRSHSQEQ